MVRPGWLGPPVFTIAWTGPATGNAAVDSAPALAIYPVCVGAGDSRCGPASGTGGAGLPVAARATAAKGAEGTAA